MLKTEWADTSDMALMRQVADFFAEQIEGDASYISHGEIQTGLSDDGQTWRSDLKERLRADLAECGDERSVLVATGDDGLAGAAIILWVQTGRTSFAVIEDMTVDLRHRSGGIGGRLVEAIESEARARGMHWAFLESGLHNERAHAFFGRNGFAALSKVFGKRL